MSELLSGLGAPHSRLSVDRGLSFPRRSVLFVPAIVLDQPAHPLTYFLARALTGKVYWRDCPDTVVLDLEDSVAAAARLGAEEVLARFLGALVPCQHMEIAVRLNTSEGVQHILETAQRLALPAVNTFMLPKLTLERCGLVLPDLVSMAEVIGIVEDAGAIRDMREIARTIVSVNDASDRHRVSGLAIGFDDLAADLRVGRDSLLDPSLLLPVSADFLVCVKSAGLQAIGPVCNRVDGDLGASEVHAFRKMGFDGCLTVFPPQIAGINSEFTPGKDQVAFAKAVLGELEIAATAGLGWVIHDGVKYDTADVGYLRWICRFEEICGEIDSIRKSGPCE